MTTRNSGFVLLALVLLMPLAIPLASAQTNQPGMEELIREGNLYYARGDCQLAQYIFQEALKLDADNIDAMLGRGRALVCQGAVNLGIEEYRRVIALDSNNVTAHIRLATAYRNEFLLDPTRNANSLEQALSAVRTAEQIDNSDPRVFNVKGVLLYQLGDYQEARNALEQAVSLAPAAALPDSDTSRIQANLGRAYRELGEASLALTSFRRAVSLDPTNYEARNYLGETHFRAGNCEDAIFELTQAANLAPDSLSSVSNLAIVLFECDQTEAAVPRIRQALELDSVSIPALYTYLARVYISQGRFNEAVQEAQKGALLPPTNAEALYWLGRAYQEAGNAQSAREAYQRALELEPDQPESRQALNTLP